MKKILVADDDPGISMVTRLALSKDFTVVTVSDGTEALNELERDSSYSCVLLDVEMPKMNGISVLTSMKRSPSLQNIPVVILTGNDDLKTQAEALTQGVATYFHKPFIPSQLHTIVMAITRRRSPPNGAHPIRRAAKTENDQESSSPGKI
jgi:DNA-binding response OmpR family regulator